VVRMPERSARGWRALVLGLTACVTMVIARTGWAQAQDHQVPAPKMVITDYDMKKAATPPPLSDVQLTGKKLFIQRCALCHDLLGQPATTTVGPWIDGELVKAKGDQAIRERIMSGSRRMPAWRYTLDARQIDSVIAYLKTVTPDMKPKPGGQVTGPIE
jgi:mono/diheme cytochrome c family protein